MCGAMERLPLHVGFCKSYVQFVYLTLPFTELNFTLSDRVQVPPLVRPTLQFTRCPHRKRTKWILQLKVSWAYKSYGYYARMSNCKFRNWAIMLSMEMSE